MKDEDLERKQYRRRTQGIKGEKLPRINMAFDPDVYDFIRRTACSDHTTMTSIVNDAVRARMDTGDDHE